jgi:anaerobic selenocysteine-containing dehydrogenase
VHPDQNRMRRGLAREDIFMVGIDVAMTESMAHCDVLLPAATHFESPDIYVAYGHPWMQRAEPVIPPQGESVPNTEIFRRLAARFGFADPCFAASDAELMDDALDAGDTRLGGPRPSEAPLDSATEMRDAEGRSLVLFENVRPATPSGKIELESEALAKRWGEQARLPQFRGAESDYPLRLISPASDRRISSTLGGLAPSRRTPALRMHPSDAAARGLASGSDVRVWNGRGEVVLALLVTDAVPRGVVASEKGAWLATSATGQTISALVDADMRADIAEGACFNDTGVEVAAA